MPRPPQWPRFEWREFTGNSSYAEGSSIGFEEARHLLDSVFKEGIQALREEQQRFMRQLQEQLGRPINAPDVIDLKIAGDDSADDKMACDNSATIEPCSSMATQEDVADFVKQTATRSVAKTQTGAVTDLRQSNCTVAASDHVDWKLLPQTWPPRQLDRRYRISDIIEPHMCFYTQTKWWAAAVKLVSSTAFDYLMGVVIVANVGAMCIRTQYRASHTAHLLGMRPDDAPWRDKKTHFEIAEFIFCAIYMAELLLRLCFLGIAYLCNFWNCCDAMIVALTSVETFIFPLAGLSSDGSITPVARLLRIARIARIAKIIRVAKVFQELRIIFTTIGVSLRAMLWSSFVVLGIVLAGGILMTQLMTAYMEEESVPMEERVFLFRKYGDALKATYTIFEHTLSTAWVPDARRVIEEVDGLFAVFWVTWAVLVNFAIMRVIAALFLKHTLAVASEDAQRMECQRMKERDDFVHSIREIFTLADTSGDGVISAAEFVNMVYNPDVQEAFMKLELELGEITMLFRLLADQDGEADYEEFLTGTIQLKGHAQNVDIIRLLHETARIRKQLSRMSSLIKDSK